LASCLQQYVSRMKKIFITIATIVIVLITSCGGSDNDMETLPNEEPGTNPYATIVEDFDLLMPSGNRVYGMIRRPDPAVYPNRSFAAVVMIPGGIGPGRLDAQGTEAKLLAESGMVVVCFNAEGRVSNHPDDIASEGTEDFNGFRHQDGLAKILQYVISLDYVIPDNVGIITQSYGITMAAGCAGRHPEVPIKYIVDGEGPSNSFVTAHEPWALYSPLSHPYHNRYEQVHDLFGHYSIYRDFSPENQAFWAEREADKFIGEFRGRYLRLQAEWDHVQPPSEPAEIPMFHQPPMWWQCKHATDMVNAAVTGGVPWVRVNLPEHSNLINTTYDADNQPVYLPRKLADNPWPVRAVLEMARMD
jgi:hypothetical protein